MNNIKKNTDSFIIETYNISSIGLVKGFNNMFSVDLANVLKDRATLEIQRKASSTTQKVDLTDVEYYYDNSKSSVTYKFFLEDNFDGINHLTMSVSKIHASSFSYPYFKYYIYENGSAEISYKFIFQLHK